MVTAAKISQHDRTVDASILATERAIDRAIREYVNNLTDRLAATPTPEQVRTTLLQDTATLTQFYAVFGAAVTRAALDQLNLLDLDSTQTRTVTLNTIVSATQRELETETTGMLEAAIAALILASISGTPVTEYRRLSRTVFQDLGKKIKRTIADLTLRADAAFGIGLMKSQGVERFRYAGGTTATSREFCRSHDGKVYTEREIRQIWSSQTWGGKRPGDPFVVRGGYNCRHYWVPATGEEQ